MIPCGWLWAALAWAHPPGMSQLALTEHEIVLVFSAREPVIGGAEVDQDPLAWAAARTDVRADGRPCAVGSFAGPTAVEGDGIRYAAAYRCPPALRRTVRAGHLDPLPPDHESAVTWQGTLVGVATRASPEVTLPVTGPTQTADVARAFLRAGVAHIWAGLDHLAFVAALLVGARGWRDAAVLVSGFTLGHSLTLTAAALGWARLSPAWVEPCIALSITVAAAEAVAERPLRRRAAWTAAMGLLHGFGFAGALREIGLPPERVAVALGSFNVGVELGQLVVVAACLPLLTRLRGHPAWESRGRPAAAGALALAGFSWFLSRLTGYS